MRKRFEDLHEKNRGFSSLKHTNWWVQITNDILDTYDKLTPTKEYLVENPLSQITRIAKRNVLIFSCLIILVSTYGLSTNGINIFGLSLASENTYVFEGSFSLILCYQLISFSFHYIRDIMRLFQVKIGLAHESLVYPLYLINNHLLHIERAKNHDSRIEDVIKSTDKYADFVDEVSSNYLKIKAYICADVTCTKCRCNFNIGDHFLFAFFLIHSK